jgi:hypothetical protein
LPGLLWQGFESMSAVIHISKEWHVIRKRMTLPDQITRAPGPSTGIALGEWFRLFAGTFGRTLVPERLKGR